MRKGWTETNISDLLELSIGGVWGNDPGEDEIDVFVYRQTEFDNNGTLSMPSDAIRSITKNQLKSRTLQPGDVLMQKSAGTPTLPGRVVIVPPEIESNATCSNFLHLLRADTDKCNPRFLFWYLWLNHQSGRAFEFQRGTNIKNLDLNQYLNQPVLLPSLSEQKRIVDVVSSVDAYIDALQQQADLARVARNSIAENVVNTDFPKTQLLALGRLVTGSTPSTKRPKFWKPEEVMFLTPGDFGHQLLIAETARKVSNEGAVAGRILQPNSVVQVCIGATIGKVGIIEQSLITNQQINALEGLSKNDAYFAALMLSSHRMKSELSDISGKTTMPIISKSTWGSLEIPWPNDKVRQAVSEVARSIDEYEKQLNIAITATKKLRFGLLSDLLSGNHEIPASYDSLLGAA